MCVCVCVCVCVCACLQVWVCEHVYVCMHFCVCMFLEYMCVCSSACVCVCVHFPEVCVCVCVCVCAWSHLDEGLHAAAGSVHESELLAVEHALGPVHRTLHVFRHLQRITASSNGARSDEHAIIRIVVLHHKRLNFGSLRPTSVRFDQHRLPLANIRSL